MTFKTGTHARVTNPLPGEHREFEGDVGEVTRRYDNGRGDFVRLQFGDESRWWDFHALELSRAHKPKVQPKTAVKHGV